MEHKAKIHHHINAAAEELLAFVRISESAHEDRWVPGTQIKNSLELNFAAVPRQGTQYGPKGWLFAVLARMLEDQNRLEHVKIGSRSFFRTRSAAK